MPTDKHRAPDETPHSALRTPHSPEAIDRLCARLGAGPVATSRRGMGWLLTEVIPVFVWAQVTGALLGESFYLVTYLTLLGAEPQTLALLPLVAYGGNACSSLLVFARPSHDAKRRCTVDTGVGRFFWLGTVLWPLIGLQLGWSSGTLIGGVLASIFLAQLCHAAGGSAFSAWTQAVVPRELRGRFWAWRNIASYLAVALTVLAMGALLPKGAQATREHLPWLMGCFAAVTLVCLASTWMLARSPDVPGHVQEAPRKPIREALRGHPGFPALILFNLLSLAAMASTMAYLPALLHARGIGTAAYAAAQGTAFVPAMLGGILLAGWGLGRLGGHRLLTITAVLLLAADAAYLLLPAEAGAWLVPCLILSGLSKGLWSISLIGRSQELAPNGDSRFPALMTGIGAGCAVLVALALRTAVPWMEAAGVRDLPWVLVAVAAGFRALALLAILLVDRTPRSIASAA